MSMPEAGASCDSEQDEHVRLGLALGTFQTETRSEALVAAAPSLVSESVHPVASQAVVHSASTYEHEGVMLGNTQVRNEHPSSQTQPVSPEFARSCTMTLRKLFDKW